MSACGIIGVQVGPSLVSNASILQLGDADIHTKPLLQIAAAAGSLTAVLACGSGGGGEGVPVSQSVLGFCKGFQQKPLLGVHQRCLSSRQVEGC